ncbi:alpha/beta hydrolase [Nocardiopsis sp. N85]|uniref:alpha/beta hydrolase n=1 Tax=Nocardiopsis sp. N85 TaxID=3029400 RepID=UPI00237F60DB|nr:alpha/beta hydrolase [Nocardiopsis sp. N85]MDE3722234.1 alpha/beta hydrolase [Nocardiopsis sp. N85]
MSGVADFVHVVEPAHRPRTPTLLLLHGTGADERDLLPLGRVLAPGAALLSPRGRVDEHGMNRWFRRLREGVFDVDDVIDRAEELAAWVPVALEHHGLAAPVVAVGFSNGANIAAALMLLHPRLLDGAVLLGGGYPLQGREPGAADLSGRAAFLGVGLTDPISTPDQARLLADHLSALGADVELSEHPGGHQVPPAVLEGARSWFEGRFGPH